MPDGLTEGKYVLISFSATKETDWKNAHVGRTIETARDTAPPEMNLDQYYGRFLQGFRIAWPVTDNKKYGIDFISSDAAPASFVENQDEPNDPLSLRALEDWNTLHESAMKPLKEGEHFHFPHTGIFPGGTPGVLVRGARLGDFKNHIFFPAGGPLIAHHQPLDPGKYSSRVYEIASRSLDKDRFGHLDDVFRVLGTPGNNQLLNPNAPELGSLSDPFAAQSNICGFKGNDQITLNFTESKGHGTGWGAVSFAGATPQKAKVVTGNAKQGFDTPQEEQSTARVVAYMSNESKAGPIAKGFTKCQHWIGTASDGTEHQSAHISTNALFTHGTHRALFDGPLPFTNRIAPPTLGGEYPIETTIEWDTQQNHTGPCGQKAEGRWKLITRIPIFKFDPSGGTRPNDPFWIMFPDPVKTHGEIGQGFPCENPKKKRPTPETPGFAIDPNPRGPVDPGATGDPRFDIPNEDDPDPNQPGDDNPGAGAEPAENDTFLEPVKERVLTGHQDAQRKARHAREAAEYNAGNFALPPNPENAQTGAESNNLGAIPAVSFTANFAEFKDCSRTEYAYTSPPMAPALPGGLDPSAGGSINPYSHIPGYSNGIKMEAPAVFADLCNRRGDGGGAPLEEDYDTSQIPGGVPELWSSIYATSRYAIGYLSCDRSFIVGWNWRQDGDCLNFERLDGDGNQIDGNICFNGEPLGTNPSTADQCCVTQAGHGLAVGDVVSYDSGSSEYVKADASDDTLYPNGIVSSVDGDNICITKSGPIDCPSITDDEGNELTDGLYMASDSTPGKLRNPEGALGIPDAVFVAFEKRGNCCRVVEMNVGYTFGSGGGGSFDCGQMELCPAFITLKARVDDLECPPEIGTIDGTGLPLSLVSGDCGGILYVAVDSGTAMGGSLTLPPINTTGGNACCCVEVKTVDSSPTEGKGPSLTVVGGNHTYTTGSGSTTQPALIDNKSSVTIDPNGFVRFCWSNGLAMWVRK